MLSLSTPRLQLRTLTKEQLLQYLDQPEELATELGITISRPILTETTQRAIHMKAEKMAAASERDHAWYTYWLIVLTEHAHGVGLVGYKGLTTGQEEVEIGYVIEPGHRNQGYMTEAVKALVNWAFTDPRCQAVFAPVLKTNPPSSRVLEKAGFWVERETEEKIDWRIEKGNTQ
ncbi:MAG: GNAT family N-acetyltransferase [Anaerolineales bacterium]|nr:GNAT family N-acetyltransferase [Anaerolineales bacterium]